MSMVRSSSEHKLRYFWNPKGFWTTHRQQRHCNFQCSER